MINSLVAALLKERAKYSWHNLIKEPTDLPPESASVDTWYECVHKNHEEDPYFPAYQYDSCLGSFGLRYEIFDPYTLGFVDAEFKTIEELDYEPIIAWRYIRPFTKNADE